MQFQYLNGTIMSKPVLEIDKLSKNFTLHQQNSVILEVLKEVSCTAYAGKCLVLAGHSGAGKSTLLRTIYGNYLASSGRIHLLHNGLRTCLTQATPQQILAIRRQTLGYVSQFLRVVPRVSTLDVVMTPALERGEDPTIIIERAQSLLSRLNIPERLWKLAPCTFSGGEQQRVNIARSFMVKWPILLLDEPTASLDHANAQIVLTLIDEAKASGSALIGIFHDSAVREAVADHIFDMQTKEISVCHLK